LRELDFKPIVPKKVFLAAYSLHDIVSTIGDALLEAEGFTVEKFGAECREEDVWEHFYCRPDRKVYRDSELLCLLDYKSKTRELYIINERERLAYMYYSEKFNVPCWIMLFIVDLKTRRIVEIKALNLNEVEPIYKFFKWNNIVAKFSKDDFIPVEGFIEWLHSR